MRVSFDGSSGVSLTPARGNKAVKLVQRLAPQADTLADDVGARITVLPTPDMPLTLQDEVRLCVSRLYE